MNITWNFLGTSRPDNEINTKLATNIAIISQDSSIQSNNIEDKSSFPL